MAATITVPGPRDTNAAHGLKNALDDNVPILHVSPIPDHEKFGKHPIHEHEMFDHLVKTNVTVESSTQLREQIKRGIKTALTPPAGSVRLGIPRGMLAQPLDPLAANVTVDQVSFVADDTLKRAADRLASAQRPLVYVGGGARRSTDGPECVEQLVSILMH